MNRRQLYRAWQRVRMKFNERFLMIDRAPQCRSTFGDLVRKGDGSLWMVTSIRYVRGDDISGNDYWEVWGIPVEETYLMGEGI